MTEAMPELVPVASLRIPQLRQLILLLELPPPGSGDRKHDLVRLITTHIGGEAMSSTLLSELTALDQARTDAESSQPAEGEEEKEFEAPTPSQELAAMLTRVKAAAAAMQASKLNTEPDGHSRMPIDPPARALTDTQRAQFAAWRAEERAAVRQAQEHKERNLQHHKQPAPPPPPAMMIDPTALAAVIATALATALGPASPAALLRPALSAGSAPPLPPLPALPAQPVASAPDAAESRGRGYDDGCRSCRVRRHRL